jgi:hypothetical protein
LGLQQQGRKRYRDFLRRQYISPNQPVWYYIYYFLVSASGRQLFNMAVTYFIYQSTGANYCLTALRYSYLDDRSPLTAYGCFDSSYGFTRTYYIDIGTARPVFTTSGAPISSTTLPSPGAASATMSSPSATIPPTTQPSSTINSDSDSLQRASNTIALAVGLSVPLLSLLLSAIGLWVAWRNNKLEPMRRAFTGRGSPLKRRRVSLP